ncbi:MAG TPA: hypothetical protein VGE66_00535 [Chitinophagaceae bacterium]
MLLKKKRINKEGNPRLLWSGWGQRIKILKVGKVVKLGAERVKLGKGAGIAIPHVQYNLPWSVKSCRMIACSSHDANLSNKAQSIFPDALFMHYFKDMENSVRNTVVFVNRVTATRFPIAAARLNPAS